MNADDVRKILDSAVREALAREGAGDREGARSATTAASRRRSSPADLMEAAQRNRDRVKDLVAREVKSQLSDGGARHAEPISTRSKKRVRALEKGTGSTTPAVPGAQDREPLAARRSRPRKPTVDPRRPRAPERMPRRRLDAELVRRGLAAEPGRSGRGRARRAGSRWPAAPRRTRPPSSRPTSPCSLRPVPAAFVSRGGEKLAAALERFGVDPAGRRLPRRRRLHRRVHRLPSPGGAARVDRRRRRLRAARVGTAERRPRHASWNGRTSATYGPATCRSPRRS